MKISEEILAELISQACEAAARAYCPYSKFHVGSAVLTGEGRIFAGCNVENASYGLTICAERNAVFQAVAASTTPPTITTVVVYTPTLIPTAPCGACRQVINEFGPDALVICVCDGPERIQMTLSALLPQAFGPGNLA